jgi:hypothetical protein
MISIYKKTQILDPLNISTILLFRILLMSQFQSMEILKKLSMKFSN